MRGLRWNGRSARARRGVTPAGQAGSYATTFTLTENPLSEGGIWAHNPNNAWKRLQSVNGAATPAVNTDAEDDAYAYLSSWTGGNDYELIGTTYYPNASGTPEAELLLRVSDNDTQVMAYECLYNLAGGSAIVVWFGNQHSYSILATGAAFGGHGTQVRATIIGSLITMYDRLTPGDAWTQRLQVTDSTHATGKPGLAVYITTGNGSPSSAGWQDWQVNPL